MGLKLNQIGALGIDEKLTLFWHYSVGSCLCVTIWQELPLRCRFTSGADAGCCWPVRGLKAQILMMRVLRILRLLSHIYYDYPVMKRTTQ